VRQLRPQHGSLDRVEPEVPTDRDVVILRPRAVHAEQRDSLGELGVVGEHGARIAQRPQVLRWKQREPFDTFMNWKR